MSETIVYRYVAEQNPLGAYLPGVPLRDLTAADVAEVPEWLRTSLAAQPFYVAVATVKTPPPAVGGQNG